MKVLGYIVMLFVLVSCGGAEPSVENVVDTPDEGISEIIEEEGIQDTENLAVESVEAVDEFADWGGEYFTADNKMLELIGPNETGDVDFEIGYDDIDCLGFSGLANLEKSGVANFYDKRGTCLINITYNPGVAEISTHQCGDYEDTQCGGFGGTYKLK